MSHHLTLTITDDDGDSMEFRRIPDTGDVVIYPNSIGSSVALNPKDAAALVQILVGAWAC